MSSLSQKAQTIYSAKKESVVFHIGINAAATAFDTVPNLWKKII